MDTAPSSSPAESGVQSQDGPNCFVLITGATGFVGKVLVGHIIRAHKNVHVALVVRSRGGSSAQTRGEVVIREVLDDVEDAIDRVHIYDGSINDPGFWSSDSMQSLGRHLTHIINVAASVSFSEPLTIALRTNVTSSLLIYEYAATVCTRLRSFIHISTAYVSAPNVEEIDALPVKPPSDDIVAALMPIIRSNADASEDKEPAEAKVNDWFESIKGHHANTYTFSKSLAEYMLCEKYKSNPGASFHFAIVRPSIITSSTDPSTKGDDSFAALNGALALVGCGYLHAVNLHPDTMLNTVPVDRCVSVIVAIANDHAHLDADIPHTQARPALAAEDREVLIVHATSDRDHAIRVVDLKEKVQLMRACKAPGILLPDTTFHHRRGVMYHVYTIIDRMPLWYAAKMSRNAARARKVQRVLDQVDSLHNKKSGVLFYAVHDFNFKPSQVAKAAGVVDYSRDVYTLTVVANVMLNLAKKSLVSLKPPSKWPSNTSRQMEVIKGVYASHGVEYAAFLAAAAGTGLPVTASSQAPLWAFLVMIAETFLMVQNFLLDCLKLAIGYSFWNAHVTGSAEIKATEEPAEASDPSEPAEEDLLSFKKHRTGSLSNLFYLGQSVKTIED